jgi:hypothetical protein
MKSSASVKYKTYLMRGGTVMSAGVLECTGEAYTGEAVPSRLMDGWGSRYGMANGLGLPMFSAD